MFRRSVGQCYNKISFLLIMSEFGRWILVRLVPIEFIVVI